jgi:CP family cyanate transporter-like MFS transporter
MHPALFAFVVVCLGINLRVHLGTVPALFPEIDATLHLTNATYGCLTATAIGTMGLSAPLGPWLSVRVGVVKSVALLMLVLAAGGVLRVLASSTPMLFVCSVIGGIGMGGASAVLPGLIARVIPARAGTVTGLYSSVMALGLGLAALASRPLMHILGSWERSLAVWGVLAAAVAALWLVVASRVPQWFPPRHSTGALPVIGLPWRSRTAWLVTLQVSTPMVVGLSCVSWLVPLWLERGGTESTGATLLLMFQAIQLLGALTLPVISDRLPDRRLVLAFSLTVMLLGVLVLLADPLPLMVVGLAVTGLGIGGMTALGLVLIGDVGRDPLESARMGALAFLIAFLAAAAAPALLGLLRDITGGQQAGLAVLAVVVVGALAASRKLDPTRPI